MKLKRVKPVAIPMHIMGGYDRAADEAPAREEDDELRGGEADLVSDLAASTQVLSLRSEGVNTDVPSFVRSAHGEVLPVRLEAFLGSAQERLPYLGKALLVYVLAMVAAIAWIGWFEQRWDIIFSPCMVLPGLAGATLVYHIVKNGRIFLTGARTTVEIGADPVKRGNSVQLRVVQRGRLHLHTVDVRLVCRLKTYERNRLVTRTIYDALIHSGKNVSTSHAQPWSFITTIKIPAQARQTGEHDAGAQVMWGIEYSAHPARLPKIEALYPFHVV